jgi:hypothetical protein
MHHLSMLSAAAAVSTGTTVHPGTVRTGKAQTAVQVSITGTATVKVYGRTSANMPWIELASFTASGQQLVNLFPDMKADVTAFTSGTCSAELVEG